MNPKPLVAFGLLGTTLDRGSQPSRWEKWRPTVSLFQHEDLLIDRFELLSQRKFTALSDQIVADIESVSPKTEVCVHDVEFDDPWDLEPVFEALLDFASDYPFDPDQEDYAVHITTGTHVAQICLFLLTESHHFPARLVQTRPAKKRERAIAGYEFIDLDLSKYDQIAKRFAEVTAADVSYLKQGIETRNPRFNAMMEELEKVALASDEPILLTGPTGAGKTQLARRIFELKKKRGLVDGALVEVNCATLRGDQAMSALFGHVRGAFTGAERARDGLMVSADGGLLFLDEIGELGLDEQAMLLRAIETQTFLPVGSDRERSSNFQLIAGTNRPLSESVAGGDFREDLLARINLWTFELPGLAERREDIAPNLEYELRRFAAQSGDRVQFNREAEAFFLEFAQSPDSSWDGNFRDLGAAVKRMATLAPAGRIDRETVEREIERLRSRWVGRRMATHHDEAFLRRLMGNEAVDAMDRFDRVQLADTVAVCRECSTLSEAGRRLFAESRKQKTNPNDSDRIRKYLLKWGIEFDDIHAAG